VVQAGKIGALVVQTRTGYMFFISRPNHIPGLSRELQWCW